MLPMKPDGRMEIGEAQATPNLLTTAVAPVLGFSALVSPLEKLRGCPGSAVIKRMVSPHQQAMPPPGSSLCLSPQLLSTPTRGRSPLALQGQGSLGDGPSCSCQVPAGVPCPGGAIPREASVVERPFLGLRAPRSWGSCCVCGWEGCLQRPCQPRETLVGPAFSREPLEDTGRVCLTLGPGWDCRVQQCDRLVGTFGEMDLGSSPLPDEGAPHLRSVLQALGRFGQEAVGCGGGRVQKYNPITAKSAGPAADGATLPPADPPGTALLGSFLRG